MPFFKINITVQTSHFKKNSLHGDWMFRYYNIVILLYCSIWKRNNFDKLKVKAILQCTSSSFDEIPPK